MGTQQFSQEQLQSGVDYTDQQVDATAPLVIFGAENVTSPANTRFLYPGFGDSTGASSPKSMILTRAGKFRNLRITQNNPNGNGNDIIYTLLVNGSPTALTVTMASTDASGFDIVNEVSVAASDLIAIRAVKNTGVGSGPSNIFATMEFGNA